MNILDTIDGWRRMMFHALADKKERSWVAHLALVVFGSLAPAILVGWLFGFVWGVLAYFAASEVWFDFMLAREVLDYCKHKARAVAVEDIDMTWQDGLGDLAGPLLNRAIGWIGLLWLIFGGG